MRAGRLRRELRGGNVLHTAYAGREKHRQLCVRACARHMHVHAKINKNVQKCKNAPFDLYNILIE